MPASLGEGRDGWCVVVNVSSLFRVCFMCCSSFSLSLFLSVLFRLQGRGVCYCLITYKFILLFIWSGVRTRDPCPPTKHINICRRWWWPVPLEPTEKPWGIQYQCVRHMSRHGHWFSFVNVKKVVKMLEYGWILLQAKVAQRFRNITILSSHFLGFILKTLNFVPWPRKTRCLYCVCYYADILSSNYFP